MARKIQIKRGNKAKLPTLAQGEMALCLDEQSIYIGGASGNIPAGGKAITPALIGAVNKTGDFMSGSLHATAFGINADAAYASLGVDATLAGAILHSSDNTAEGCALIVSTGHGLVFQTPDGKNHPVYHEGNPPDITVQEGEIYGALVADNYDKWVRLFATDDSANGCGLILSPTAGVQVMATNGGVYPIIHTGNLAQYSGAKTASLEE